MSSEAKPSPSRPVSNSQSFQQQKAKPGARILTSEAILDDLAEFKKRGGRIDVLGNTPLRTTTSAAFHSSSSSANKKPTTPVVDAKPGKSAG